MADELPRIETNATAAKPGDDGRADVNGTDPAPCEAAASPAPLPSVSPPPPPLIGLAALTEAERATTLGSLQQEMQVAADGINAVERSRDSRYAPIGPIIIVYDASSNALVFTIHGPCPLANRLLQWTDTFHAAQQLLHLSMLHPAACRVVENGAPRPPPAVPPPPTPHPPPFHPPASVPVQADIEVELPNLSGLVSGGDVAVFAGAVLTWANVRSSEISQVSTTSGMSRDRRPDVRVRVTERTDLTFAISPSVQADQASYLRSLDALTQATFCSETIDCATNVTIQEEPLVSSPPTAPYPSVPPLAPALLPMPSQLTPSAPKLSRALLSDVRSGRQMSEGMDVPPVHPLPLPLPPHQLPSPQGPLPRTPPSAPPPIRTESLAIISLLRVRAAHAVADAEDPQSNATTMLFRALASSPLAGTHAFVSRGEALTELTADIQLTAVAENKTTADDVAAGLFALLSDTSDLSATLAASLRDGPASGARAVQVGSLTARYMHPDRGLVVIQGALPPPPPLAFPPPLGFVTQETVDAVSVTVTVAVATTVVASVVVAVAGAVASSVAGATATATLAASTASVSSSVGSTAGSSLAGGGGGASAGGVAPLIFGVQRFQVRRMPTSWSLPAPDPDHRHLSFRCPRP